MSAGPGQRPGYRTRDEPENIVAALFERGGRVKDPATEARDRRRKGHEILKNLVKMNKKTQNNGFTRIGMPALRKRGFTLIEMLAVMMIMGILMAITIASYLDWNREAAIRGSTWGVDSSIEHARQWAITHRVRTSWMWTNVVSGAGMRGCYVVTTNTTLPSAGMVSETNYLAEGVVFGDVTEGLITFKSDGSATGGVTAIKLIIQETRTNGLTREIKVFPLTGRSKVMSKNQ